MLARSKRLNSNSPQIVNIELPTLDVMRHYVVSLCHFGMELYICGVAITITYQVFFSSMTIYQSRVANN